jgi:hypothetical protein
MAFSGCLLLLGMQVIQPATLDVAAYGRFIRFSAILRPVAASSETATPGTAAVKCAHDVPIRN